MGINVLKGRKINVGPFTASELEKSKIKCRTWKPIRPPFGDPFSDYIREALIAELKNLGIFALEASVLIIGNLDRIDFDSFPPAKWEIALTLRASSGKDMTRTFSYPYISARGNLCCELTAQAFRPAVQELLNSILQSPEFAELASE